MKRWLLPLMVFSNLVSAQTIDRLTLPQTYDLAQKNYPVIKQKELVKQTANITIENPPRKRENTPIKLFLNVSSIENARQTAEGLGGELNVPRRSGRSMVSDAVMVSTPRATCFSYKKLQRDKTG